MMICNSTWCCGGRRPPLLYKVQNKRLNSRDTWQLRREEERVKPRLVDDGSFLSSTKGVAICDALILLVHMHVKSVAHIAVSQFLFPNKNSKSIVSEYSVSPVKLPFPPLFLVESMREFVNFAASLGVFWSCSAAKSVVQPTIEHTRRTATIAATNNDNRPLISTL